MFDGADSYGVYDIGGDEKKDSQPPIKFRSWLVGYGGLGLAWIVCFIMPFEGTLSMLFFLILIAGAREFAWEGNFLIFPIVTLICSFAVHVLLSRGTRNEEQEQGAENPSEPGSTTCNL